jgi:glycine cleavage system aminomethyltransferase T
MRAIPSTGFLQVTTDGGPSMGESQKVRGLWYAVAIWVKDGPGMGKLIADWMTDGRTESTITPSTIRAFIRTDEEQFIHDRCTETAMKIYNPAVHPREPFSKGRNVRRSPFYERETELGGHFMELGGWERAHGYAANEHLLEKYGDRVPVRENEWDNRHFWRVSNAEHLEMSENVGIVNLSHFAMYDIEGPDHVALMEWLCAAKIGGDNMVGKGIYTHFLDDEGMVRADLTVIRMADRCRVIDGADAGPRDFHYMRRVAEDKGFDVTVTDVTDKIRHHRHLGSECAHHVAKGGRGSGRAFAGKLPVRGDQAGEIAGKDVTAFRISYVGEQGWELHMAYEDGLAVWDALRETGVMAFGVETYANTRRMEKSLRLQNADLLTEYNLYEADPRPPEGQGGRFPRQGEASGISRPRTSAGDAVHAGDDRQYRFQGRRPLSCRHHAGDGIRRRARRWSTNLAGILHHLGRLWSDNRQEHRAGLPAMGLLPGRPQAERGIFRRNLSGRSRRRRLHAALRSGKPQAAELIAGNEDAPSHFFAMAVFGICRSAGIFAYHRHGKEPDAFRR